MAVDYSEPTCCICYEAAPAVASMICGHKAGSVESPDTGRIFGKHGEFVAFLLIGFKYVGSSRSGNYFLLKNRNGCGFPGRFGWGVHPPQTFEVKVVKNF